MNDEQFDSLNVFEVASLIWKAKIFMSPIVITEEKGQYTITNVDCVDGEIIINVRKSNLGDEES